MAKEWREDRGAGMAAETIVLGRCLLCRRELPRVYSAEVAGILFTPLCQDCRTNSLNNPERIVSEHPRLFEHPEAKETYIPDIPSVVQTQLDVENVSGSHPQQVIITDIHMPFGSMVEFMMKWAIASIPAMILLFLLGAIVAGIFGAILTGIGSGLIGR
jgi:hypothetical protein